jgi:hypothetical protein
VVVRSCRLVARKDSRIVVVLERLKRNRAAQYRGREFGLERGPRCGAGRGFTQRLHRRRQARGALLHVRVL